MAYTIDRENNYYNLQQINNWLPCRTMKKKPSTIVLHSTAGASALSSVSWLKKIGYSYHYIVEDNGIIYKCVPTSKVAYHAGISSGPEGSNVNNYSIGIAFANMNDGEPYWPLAVQACYALILALDNAFPTLQHLTTHHNIAPKRKNDPYTFDAKGFAKVIEERTGITPWLPFGNSGRPMGHIL